MQSTDTKNLNLDKDLEGYFANESKQAGANQPGHEGSGHRTKKEDQ